jgi:PAS domain S-box-containing protein
MALPGEERSVSGKPEGFYQKNSEESIPAGIHTIPIHILYVDDDPDMSLIFKGYLEKMGGFEVTSVMRGSEAISLVMSDVPCDIVISDYSMPGMDGIELLKKIQKIPSPPPYILFTGKGREEVVMEAINNGAAFYLQKGGDPHTLFAELAHKIRQAVGKQQAESALRESEKKFRLLFESARDAILIIKDGHIADCNQQSSVFFGGNPGELIGRTIEDLSPEIQPDGSASPESWRSVTDSVINGNHAFLLWRYRRLDGSFFDSEASLNRIDLDRQPCIQVILRDITDRIQAELELSTRNIELSAAYEELVAADEERHTHMKELIANQNRLAESEKKFRELTDFLPQIIYETDAQGRITYGNRQAYLTFKYTPETLPPDIRVLDLINPEDRQRANENLSLITEDGTMEPHEYQAIRSDGTVFPIINYSARIFRDGLFQGFRGIAIDITERKRFEEALVRSEEKYRTLIDHIQDGVFIIQKGLLKFVNPAFAAIIGYSVKEIIGKKMISFIAPEDREMVVERHRKRMKGELVPTQYEFRMVKSDGKTYVLISMDIGIISLQGIQASIGTIRDVTKQRQAEEAIRESERRLADVIDFLPDATLVIDQEGRVIAWNRAMEQLTGVSAGAMLGKDNYSYAIPFYGIRRPILVDLALRADERIEQEYASLSRSGDLLIGEAYMPNIGIGKVCLWGAASPLRDSKGMIVGAIESIRDITDRKHTEEALVFAREDLEQRVAERTAELTTLNSTLVKEVEERRRAEEALRESEERYRRLIELSPDAVFVHDGTRIIFVNPAGMQLLGSPAVDDVVGLHINDIIHPNSLDRIRGWNKIRDINDKTDQTTEEQFIRTDGSAVDVEVSSAPIFYQSRPAILVVVRDITGRKRAAQQIQRYAEEMAGKNKELDFLANQLLDVNLDLDRRVKERTGQVLALMKQKDEFLTQIGHDLKTPLTPLRALLPCIIEEEQDPEIREVLSVLLKSVHSIQNQTEKILTIARLSRYDVAVARNPVLMHRCILESVENNKLSIEQKHITVTVDVAPDLTVLFSRSDAGTVFDNLIDNAIKYTNNEGHIRISSCLSGGKACIIIADDGIGLSPDEAEHVFEEFYMADRSRHDRSSSGLGLSIVRRLVRLYGGTVRVESKGKGCGSTFFVCLPYPGCPGT